MLDTGPAEVVGPFVRAVVDGPVKMFGFSNPTVPILGMIPGQQDIASGVMDNLVR